MGILLRAVAAMLVLQAVSAAPALSGDKVLLAARPYGASESAVIWNNRGADLFSLGRYKQAISAFDRAIRVNPRYTEAYSNRGAAYDALNQPDRAVLDYTQAIRLNPRFTGSYYNRALAYCDLGRFSEAINDWNVVLKRSSRDASAYYKRGFCHQSLGNLEAAYLDFDKAARISPRMVKASKARDFIRKALALAPSSAVSGNNGGTQTPADQSNAHSHPPAAKSSKSAVRLEDPFTPFPMERPTAEEHQIVRQMDESPSAVSDGPTRSPELSPGGYCVWVLHHVLGNLCMLTGQPTAAAMNYSTALNANPVDPFAYYRRANAYASAGEFDKALSDYENALRLKPKFKQASLKRERLTATLTEYKPTSGEASRQ